MAPRVQRGSNPGKRPPRAYAEHSRCYTSAERQILRWPGVGLRRHQQTLSWGRTDHLEALAVHVERGHHDDVGLARAKIVRVAAAAGAAAAAAAAREQVGPPPPQERRLEGKFVEPRPRETFVIRFGCGTYRNGRRPPCVRRGRGAGFKVVANGATWVGPAPVLPSSRRVARAARTHTQTHTSRVRCCT